MKPTELYFIANMTFFVLLLVNGCTSSSMWMNNFIKKMIVLLPVLIAGLYYLNFHLLTYHQTSNKRIMLLGITFFALYGWIILEILARAQKSFSQVFIQTTFFVYIFAVLTLTGFFILYREVPTHDWWDKILRRINTRDRVNLELFRIFSIYRLSNIQIIGNFFMLLPLGFYLPYLYRRLSHFWAVALIACLLSASIEFLQLITNFRSADVDDILLNTVGACAGYVVFRVFFYISKRSLHSSSDISVLAQ